MKSLLLFLTLANSASAENAIDMSSLFTASGLSPSCSSPCLTDLVHATRELLYFKDTVANFHSLCSTYENASLCVASTEVSCGKTSSFALNSYPIATMCNRKSDALAPLIPCVEKNIDGLLNVCDSSCLFTSSLSEISRRETVQKMAENGGDNRFSFVTELSTLCPAASCMISCLSKSLNIACPPAGDDIIGALLRPFHVYAEMIDSDEELKNIVFKIAPPTCYPFLIEDGLEKMLAGEYAKDTKPNDESVMGENRSMDEEDVDDLPSVEDNNNNLSTLLSASGLPSCSDACLSDLLIAATKIFNFNNTIDNFAQLCSMYDDASLCVASQEIECIHSSSFSIGVSGLEEQCKTKQEEFAKHSMCLRPILDESLSNCDSSCQLTSAFSYLISSSDDIVDQNENGDRDALYQELAPVCPAMSCMISCIARSLNRDCAPAGTEIVEALLRPFVKVSEMLIETGPESLDAVRSVLPSSCQSFISLTDLSDMMQGVVRSASPSETSVLSEPEIDDTEAVIVPAVIEETEATNSLMANAVLEDQEQSEDDEPELFWGRPGQVIRPKRIDMDEV